MAGFEKVAFVTGAGSGIGRAIALRFAKSGIAVAVVDRDGAAAEETRTLLESSEAIAIAADISDEAQVTNAITRTTEAFGQLDWAVNNAGVTGGSPGTDDWNDVLWSKAVSVNLLGTMYCMKHQIGWMLGSGGGAIVNIASIAGLIGIGGLSYTATKHAIVGMTRNVGARYLRQGVRINAICPGTVRTPMLDRLGERSPDALVQLIEDQPSGRLGEPEEIADVAYWLCSDQASYLAGQAIAVDGGYTVV